MNKLFFWALSLAFYIPVFSQNSIDVITGPSYENDVYYSLENGSIKTESRSNWDLAFSTARFDVNVLANHASGVEVYTYPDGDIYYWDDVDVSGMSNWNQMYNSIHDLLEGSLMQNLDPTDPFDFGWGKYNPASHIITGDSLYVVKTRSGSLKKMWIVEKNPNMGHNTWLIKIANVDGSDEFTQVIECDPVEDLNFVHFSIDDQLLLEREPKSENWDLLFSKYYDYTIPYSVTGVSLNSIRVNAYQVDDVDQATFDDYEETLFHDSLDVIGYDWKSFSGTGYSLDEDRVFFIKTYNDGDSTYWKLYFTGFTGSSEGKYTFVQQKLGSSDTETIDLLQSVEIFPNPVSNELYVELSDTHKLNLSVLDLNGKVVRSKRMNGEEKWVFSLENLKDGMYVLLAESDQGKISKSFIKQ